MMNTEEWQWVIWGFGLLFMLNTIFPAGIRFFVALTVMAIMTFYSLSGQTEYLQSIGIG
jgi:hypothetical protein